MSELSSLQHILSLLTSDKPDITYDKETVMSTIRMDNLLETYTDHLALTFQRMLVNKRALSENCEYVKVVNTGSKNSLVFELDTVCSDPVGRGRVLQHTKVYGKHNGGSFQTILALKLRQKLNHISGFIQNKITDTNGKTKEVLGTELFRVFVDFVYLENEVVIRANLNLLKK
jgi:hypothetical protein